MTIHPSRIVASVLLVAGGFVVAVAALGIVLAHILVEAGLTVRATDAALLDDIVALLPFVVAFAVANLVAALGLLAGRTWADTLAVGSAVVAVTFGALGLLLIVVGRDPFAPVGSAGSGADGIGILAGFTIYYLAIIVALSAASAPRHITTGAAA